MDTIKKHLPFFSNWLSRTICSIREANPLRLILRILLITTISITIVWDIAVQTPFSPMHFILLCLYLAVVNILLFLPSKPLRGSDSWFFRLSFLAVYIGAVFGIWDELKWIYTGAEEAIRNYVDINAWLVYWAVPAISYALLRRAFSAVYHASAAVSGFVKRFAEGVRKSSLLQITAVVLGSVLFPFAVVYIFSVQITLSFTHEYFMWLLPAILLNFLLLPAKRLFGSVFWFIRVTFLLIYTGAMTLVLDRLLALYWTFDRPQLYSYADYPYWAAAWIIPAGIYGLIRFAIIKAGTKESKSGRALRNIGVLWSPFLKIERNDQKGFHVVRSALITLLFLVAVVVSAVGVFLTKNFPNMDFEAVTFTLNFANGDYSSKVKQAVYIIAGAVMVTGILFFIAALRREHSSRLTVISVDKKEQLECDPENISLLQRTLPAIAIGAAGLFVLADTLNVGHFIYYRLHPSTLYEDHYVEPSPDIIHFPEDKKNLVYIYMESYENTYSSMASGGNQTTNYMPELTKLADDNMYFSNCDGRGGQSVFFPTVAYTMASSVAQTSGVPLTTAVGNPREDLLHDPMYTNLLASLIRLEDILHDAGYNQLFARGDSATFAGYNTYVARYENEEILDANAVKNGNYLPREPKGAWGVEDCLLFPVIKEKVREMAEKDAPFAVTAYTIDTHSYEHGFRCQNCDPSIKDDYIAAVECSNRIVSDFVHWLEKEPYGDDTVVIVVGDHLADIKAKELRWEDDGYVRTTYNCFVNAQKTPVSSKNRVFTTMDMFPTTLSALGVTIDGDRLGLGTDLFSETPTLCEEMGEEEFVEQVQMRSYYYNSHFWQPIDLPRNVFNSHT